MNENAPLPSPQPPVRNPGSTPDETGLGPLTWWAAGTTGKKVRWFAARAVAVVGSLVLLSAVVVGGAGWYTSRPSFCNSCHIMEPYYNSWQQSVHHDVSCIKCHFPPGAAEEIHGKMLGLVQLTKYITSSAGPKPTAEIPDASCLRSGCHETRLLSGKLNFNGVPFDHRPHLEQERRGKKLRCTSCHSQIVQGSHMTVTTSTCFLCHFKDEHFNEGLSACTRCHQIPEKDFDLGGGVTYNHNLAYEQGVDCSNCHGDLIRGKGEVPRERCSVCHNRKDDLERIGDHVLIHQKHVTEHNVDCLSCHLEIQHSLDQERLLHAASNCSSCHPNHHGEQVNMLLGIGAKSIHPRPSAMTAARIACPSCHRFGTTSATGAVLWKGSIEACADCHDSAAVKRLESYHTVLQASLSEIEACVGRVREALKTADLKPGQAADTLKELENVQSDLQFLRAGNDVHNMHYANTLTRALVEKLSALSRELSIDEPIIKLPELTKGAPPAEAEPQPNP